MLSQHVDPQPFRPNLQFAIIHEILGSMAGAATPKSVWDEPWEKIAKKLDHDQKHPYHCPCGRKFKAEFSLYQHIQGCVDTDGHPTTAQLEVLDKAWDAGSPPATAAAPSSPPAPAAASA